ncbi:MAG: ECF-type sigma factor [Candidatus Eisenbacteria bacterium]
MTDDAMKSRPQDDDPTDETTDVDGPTNPMADEIFRALYDDLRAIARMYFRRERPGHTLQPTAVVHEAYLRFRRRKLKENLSRADALAILSQMLRNYLIDYHRKRNTKKRGGGLKKVTLVTDIEDSSFKVLDALALEEALEALEKEPRGERLLKGVLFHYMARLTFEEIGPILGISPSRARDDWAYSRAFLGAHLM